ncbi:hypothetical protein GIB67_033269 [Kingdonia uniflora]|uniref:mRNA guanylyltransferase n=1 Tax=Kingdonia uniflora TaxID=39325 RepID=A0A7J7MPT0_9MAGN|nr:hypothetical protein GIB67_033269 [Kingdonia uniflora]
MLSHLTTFVLPILTSHKANAHWMIVPMDLNASPLPEDDEEVVYNQQQRGVSEEEEENEEDEEEAGFVEQQLQPQPQPQQHNESKNELLKERERRRQQREYPDEGQVAQPRRVEPKISRFYDRNKLPPGWLDCPAFGQIIGYIIPSKVPLGEFFNDYIIPGKRYSLRQVIHQQRVLGREVSASILILCLHGINKELGETILGLFLNLFNSDSAPVMVRKLGPTRIGLVIDLTNSTRYYPVLDWKKQGIKHVKIACKGRDSVPDNESVNNFVYEVLQFPFRSKSSKKFILVHCTHGHNRTGFMIVHFLMRSQPISVTRALQAFASARPPGIYKEDYIEALYEFYHEKRPDTVICPSTPDWKRGSDFDLNGEAVVDDEDDGIVAPSLQEDNVQNKIMTNDDVLGDSIPYDQQDKMRCYCYQILKLNSGAKGYSQFPGSHPVSLNRENLQLLRQRYYYATWKADGTRYMMLITWDGCYLIDRNFCFRRIQMRFPTKQTNEAGKDTHNLTLLDGEMVIDTQPDTSKQERRYLIYDMMAINQLSIVERPFGERWKMLEKEVIEPRNMERSRNISYRYDLEPFRVRRKDFWLLSTVTKLLKEFIPRLSHEADGLIFQGWDDPYVPRTHEGLLKWKYPEMNSVDFLFKVLDENRQLLFLNERGREKLMEGNQVVFKDGEDPVLYSGKIVECSWDSEEAVWVCMRVRVDKSTPNEFYTYKKVMRSIKDNITEDVLLDEIGEIVRLPMYADRIRMDSKANVGRRR